MGGYNSSSPTYASSVAEQIPVGEKCWKPLAENNRHHQLKFVSAGGETVLQHGRQAYQEESPRAIQSNGTEHRVPNKREVHEYIRVFHQPPIQPRESSRVPMRSSIISDAYAKSSKIDLAFIPRDVESATISSLRSMDGGDSDMVDFDSPPGGGRRSVGLRHRSHQELVDGDQKLPKRHLSGRRMLEGPHNQYLSLRGKAHVNIDNQKGFSLSRSHRRQPIARDWSPVRKRFVAAVACINTALIGILVGIYAGEVPSIQYYIADFHHYAILGNVFFFIALAIPTMLFWPLPLMHGRKPYVLGSMTIAMPLLFPQAVAVQMQRSPYTCQWRVGLILPRTFMGLALGFAQMNFLATLLDLFGASLMSSNPHQEVVDEFDVRRHGGGIGLWLGIWTWAHIGSVGLGFLIGASIINTESPDWGFYVSIIIIAAVTLINVVTPEVRRSAFRRSVAEIRTRTEVTRRLARGEVMMHRTQNGPSWWGQEVQHGCLLSLDMLRQPGFMILALYTAWIYGMVILVIVVSACELRQL